MQRNTLVKQLQYKSIEKKNMAKCRQEDYANFNNYLGPNKDVLVGNNPKN